MHIKYICYYMIWTHPYGVASLKASRKDPPVRGGESKGVAETNETMYPFHELLHFFFFQKTHTKTKLKKKKKINL